MTELGDFHDFTDDDSEDHPRSEGSTGAETRDRNSPADRLGVGALVVSQGLRIDEEGDGTTIRAYITQGNRSNIRLGTYLIVPYPKPADDNGETAAETLFCKISALEYAQQFHTDDATEINARRAMDGRSIDETDYKYLATLTPLATLYEDDGNLKRRMADRVPQPNTMVRLATDETEIKTGLKIPSDGIYLGDLAVGGERVRTIASPPTIDYRLKDDYSTGDPLIFRHSLIAGGTGSGKTHFAKNVLRQILSETRRYPMGDGRSVRPAVIQFDPQDEYAQMHDDNPDLTDEDARSLERAGIEHGGHDDTVAFVPKIGSSSYAPGHHRAESVEFTIPFSMVYENPWLVAGGGLNDNQYGALTRELLPRFRDTYSNAGTYSEFLSFLDDRSLRESLDESGAVHEATFDAVFRRVRGFSDVFDQDARSITDLVSEFVRPGGLSVVPTYHVSRSRATVTVVLALASLIIDEKLSNDPRFDRIKETPILLGMDEAHKFLTAAESVQARKVIGTFTEAAKQGRKERLGLFLITQDPHDIAESVFKQINTKIVLNLSDDDAIKSVNIPAALESKVPYMEKGQLVVYSPDNSEPVELIGLSTCVTRHGRE